MSDNLNDQVWYFFCAPNYKYSNGQRIDRKTKAGFWKVTGKDRKIPDKGVKKTLVFYQGRFSNTVRTNWVMHQYTADFNFPIKRDFAICKLKNKTDLDDMERDQSSNENHYASNYGEELNQQFLSSSGYNPPEDVSEQMQVYMQPFDGYKEMDYNLNSALQRPNNNYY